MTNRRFDFLRCALALLGSVTFGALPAVAYEAAKPNIVWIMAEDIGPDLGCYGTPALQTPNIDKLAASGLQLERAYCTAPICSTNRSAMMTGMYQTTIGAHHHRSTIGKLPEPIRPITHFLKQQGYYCAIGCGYGKKTDFNFTVDKEDQFDGNDWKFRKEGQPFFAHIQLGVTHRGGWWEKNRKESADPVDPAKVALPPYLPDHPAIRLDWATYLDQMEKADEQVGEIVARLEKEGLIDNTLIIFIGDNGRCVFRGKGFVFEDGIRIPAIFSWPGHIKPGTKSNELVSVIDMSAEVLAVAGAKIPSYMEGRPFLEEGVEPREYVFAARDRWDEVYDKCRTIVGKRYKFIRNDMPEVPYFTTHAYEEKVRPIRPVLWQLYQDGKMNDVQAYLMQPQKPKEELYDLENDPWETKNLIEFPAYAAEADKLRKALQDWEETTDDKGRYPEPAGHITKQEQKAIADRLQSLKDGTAAYPQ
ncbi:sulfatase [Blastopirellula sp. JC732]|uniref:Sulfatase n=1 Tax=Blastopirellula sediminis TaxID=2894196 RepID=A0A9X1ML36_9BACT|nr:sulfatase [Blastopirellula sediminis]MCC9608387.1 sulfatase [Blastopirellula sediminis]MCC9628836.1 sulfatase [Blastopirellula sediminis]